MNKFGIITSSILGTIAIGGVGTVIALNTPNIKNNLKIQWNDSVVVGDSEEDIEFSNDVEVFKDYCQKQQSCGIILRTLNGYTKYQNTSLTKEDFVNMVKTSQIKDNDVYNDCKYINVKGVSLTPNGKVVEDLESLFKIGDVVVLYPVADVCYSIKIFDYGIGTLTTVSSLHTFSEANGIITESSLKSITATTFAGWSTKSPLDTGELLDFSSEVKVNKPTTLYAVYKDEQGRIIAPTLKLTFNDVFNATNTYKANNMTYQYNDSTIHTEKNSWTNGQPNGINGVLGYEHVGYCSSTTNPYSNYQDKNNFKFNYESPSFTYYPVYKNLKTGELITSRSQLFELREIRIQTNVANASPDNNPAVIFTWLNNKNSESIALFNEYMKSLEIQNEGYIFKGWSTSNTINTNEQFNTTDALKYNSLHAIWEAQPEETDSDTTV